MFNIDVDVDRTRITKKKTENYEEGLNGLPDHLLLVILSLLPLKSAIATAVLSRRWRWLWTNLIDINIDIDYNQLLPFLHNVLPKFTSPYIRCLSLNLSFTNSDINEYESRHIGSWFDWAAYRNKHIRELRFVSEYESLSPNVPLWVFQLPSLVQLELSPWLVLRDDYDYGDILFNLPNLKKACVEFLYLNPRAALEKLLSCSPLLEDLSFTIDDPRGVYEYDYVSVNLSSRSLKRLEMWFTGPIDVVINAPYLDSISIRILGVTVRPCHKISFLHSPIALLDCSIYGDDDNDTDILLPSNFYSVISGVRSLITLDQITPPLIAQITFRNLTHLQFKVGHALYGLDLLQQCPALEVLTYDMHKYVFSDFGWSLTNWALSHSPPQCLVTRVKRIEILAHPFVDRLEYILLQLLNYLLHNAQALELLRITITPPHRDSSRIFSTGYDEVHFIEELYEIPRSSPLCRVEFYSPNRRIKFYKFV